MSDKALVCVLIDQFGILQRIKKANGDHENHELDYALKVTIAKLSYCGVNVEDITFT